MSPWKVIQDSDDDGNDDRFHADMVDKSRDLELNRAAVQSTSNATPIATGTSEESTIGSTGHIKILNRNLAIQLT